MHSFFFFYKDMAKSEHKLYDKGFETRKNKNIEHQSFRFSWLRTSKPLIFHE